jgi:hypothetical protein
MKENFAEWLVFTGTHCNPTRLKNSSFYSYTQKYPIYTQKKATRSEEVINFLSLNKPLMHATYM